MNKKRLSKILVVYYIITMFIYFIFPKLLLTNMYILIAYLIISIGLIYLIYFKIKRE